MEFSYKKNDNQVLFKSLEENPAFGILSPQNYIPLYNNFFSLSAANYNNITLNQRWRLNKLNSQETANIFKCTIKDDTKKETNKKENRLTYLKFSPLLDPLKYLMGKYDITDATLFNLPAFGVTNTYPKMSDSNNSAYVDSFFSFLSSKLLHEYNFLHGLDFYGSFLAIKNDFRYNIIDDIEMLNECAFFKRNDKVLYELEYAEIDDTNDDTRNYKKKIQIIDDDSLVNLDDKTILSLSDITDITQLDLLCKNELETELISVELDMTNQPERIQGSSKSSAGSSCSSRTSNTTCEEDRSTDLNIDEVETSNAGAKNKEGGAETGEAESLDEDYEDVDEDVDVDVDEDDDDDDDDDDEEFLMAKIKQFPIQVIALEKCESTLDSLMTNEIITPEIWESIVMQILFSLITFQNAFHFTHNDLHTNNVMYCKTDIKFLYYKLNHVYYKVPTYGKLFKIIDFGRAIYKFRGQLLCSDSYHPEGDAATQYNCEPYFNTKKPRLDPNMSFDLCRLGCALYDYLMDEPATPIHKIMLDWITDDKGRNILYKKNGDERYPDFKLYKMIARTVNKHIPINVLHNSYLDKFIVNKKEVKSNIGLMDLDAIPSFS